MVTNILRAPVLVDIIHSLQNFAWITINNRRKMRSRFSFFCSLYTIIITIKNKVSIRRFSFYLSIPWSIWERLSKRVWRWSINLWQCRKKWAVVSLSEGQLINASRYLGTLCSLRWLKDILILFKSFHQSGLWIPNKEAATQMCS